MSRATKNDPSQREKWDTEVAFRERELALQEREQVTRESELQLKEREHRRAAWRNPLFIAILAAAIAAAGNAVVTMVNGTLQRKIEDQKSEQARILEMIKTGDPDKAAENLQFLLDAGLITNPERAEKLRVFLAEREPGSGPTLATPSSSAAILGSIVGVDDAVNVGTLDRSSTLVVPSQAVGRLRMQLESGIGIAQCTAFLVHESYAVTAGHCAKNIVSAVLLLGEMGQEQEFAVDTNSIEVLTEDGEPNYALLKLTGAPGHTYGNLAFADRPPIKDEPLAMVMFRGSGEKLVVSGVEDCRVVDVEPNEFHHLCDSGAGTSGAPVLARETGQVLGIHYRRGTQGGVATRADAFERVSAAWAANK